MHCAKCDCVSVPDRYLLTPEQERRRYTLHQNAPDDEGYRAFLAQLMDRLVPLLKPGAEGLDYGCGEPPVLVMMLEQAGFRMAGYDLFFRPDPSVLKRSYDFIVCSETAEHFREPLAEFARLQRMLRPGGVLGVMTGMLDDWADFRDWHYRSDATHICFYSPRTMRWIAHRFGWRCELLVDNVTIFRQPSA